MKKYYSSAQARRSLCECRYNKTMRYNMDPQLLIARVITLVIAFTIHEFSHAFWAVRLGDETPRREGRLTLNPLKHLDPWGCVMLIASGFGWAKSVHVNRYALERRNKAGFMLVSLAGPLSNFVLAAIAAFLLVRGIYPASFPLPSLLPAPTYFLSQFIFINLSLMVFNLVPLTPLDGEKVLDYFIPKGLRSAWNSLQRYGMYILMALFFVLPYLGIDVFGTVLSPLVYGLYRFLTGGY